MIRAMGAAAAWARADVRSRWRSIVVAGLIAGIAAGIAVACVDGALRTDTALSRLREATDASDAVVFPSQVRAYQPDWSGLVERPEVARLAPWALVFGTFGPPFDTDPEGLVFAPVGDDWLRTVDRPIVVDGRMFDPAADDEVVVASDLARVEGISVGNTFAFTPYTPEDVPGQDGPLHGPDLTMHVVGLIHSSMEHLFVEQGLVVASPGLLTMHPELQPPQNAMVQLRDGPAGIPALQVDVNRLVADGAPVLDLAAVSRRITTTTHVERTVLLLVALAIAVAALVLVGQMLNRSASVIGEDAPALEAMGMTRRAVAGAATVAHLPAVLSAVVACVATTAAVSTALPFGLARRVDPDPGLHVGALTLLPGLVLLVTTILSMCFLAAHQASEPNRGSVGGGSAALRWIRGHAPPTVGIGASLAFGRGRDAHGAPVRAALLGAVVGILGVAGAATVDAGLRDAVAHPERAGMVWDAELRTDLELSPDEVSSAESAVGQIDAVDTMALVDRESVPLAGVGVPSYALRDAGEPTRLQLTTIEGRAPVAPGEVAIGPATAEALDLHLGSTAPLGDGDRTVSVVGIALFPTDVHAEFDQGVWLLPADLDALRGRDPTDAESFLAVRFDPTSDAEADLAALQDVADTVRGYAQPADEPPELHNLRDVLPLPRWLALALTVLALAALAHLLASSARSGARDFAVLRALGVTRRGTSMVIHVQSIAMVLVGAVVGVPLGIAAGRVGWRLIAQSVPLEVVTPLALLALVLVVPLAALASQVLALPPSGRVRRIHPAEVLRDE